jgi:prevent-host-death family protein
MITVGIRQLKTKLSEYLRDVKRGKSIVITVKGQVVALLLPAENHYDVEIARELTRKGIGTWKGGKPKGVSRPVIIKGKPLSQIVIEDRR